MLRFCLGLAALLVAPSLTPFGLDAQPQGKAVEGRTGKQATFPVLEIGQASVVGSIADPFLKQNPLSGSSNKMYVPVGEQKKLVEFSLKPVGKDKRQEELKPGEGDELVIVPVSWRAPPNSQAVNLKFGNLLFYARAPGDVPKPGVAISPVGPVEGEAFWLIPEPGQGVEFEVNTKVVPAHSVAVAFLVPKRWKTVEVLYAEPIGSASLLRRAP